MFFDYINEIFNSIVKLLILVVLDFSNIMVIIMKFIVVFNIIILGMVLINMIFIILKFIFKIISVL